MEYVEPVEVIELVEPLDLILVRVLNGMEPEARMAVVDRMLGLLVFCPDCGQDYGTVAGQQHRVCHCYLWKG